MQAKEAILKLIYGRAGTGKSEYVFNDVKRKIDGGEKNIYIITPEQFSFTAEKRLLDTLNQEAVLETQVLSFDRMAYKVINETMANQRIALSKSAKSMIILDILNSHQRDLNFLGKSMENVNLVLTQLTELKKHNITIDRLKLQIEKTQDKYLKAKLQDIYLMYEGFQKHINDRFIDENDLLTLFAENIKNSHLFDNGIFYIDEFSGFTKQEFLVIEKINEIAKEVYITVCTDDLRITKSPEADIFYDNKQTIQTLCNTFNLDKDRQIKLCEIHRFKNEDLKFLEQNLFSFPYNAYERKLENIELTYADNNYVEIENVCTKIIKLVRDNDYRFNEIAVICNNLEGYSSLVKAIFAEYEIPVFIDEKKDIAQNIIIKYVLSILDIFAKSWSYDSVFNYLKTGVQEVSNLYELENYCLKWGIQGKKFYQNIWAFEKDKNNEKEINYNADQEKIIKPLLNLKDSIENKTVIEISEALEQFLKQNLFYSDNKLKEKINTQESVEGYNIVMSTLDEIKSVFGSKKISFENFSKLLKAGLSAKELNQIPLSQDRVVFGDVNRSKTHRVRAVFIVGVNDGVFPKGVQQEGFINDKDRENLKHEGFELAKGTKEKMYEENFNIYKAFATAEERLYISYSASDINGDNLRKSLIISRLRKVFPKLEEKKVEPDQVLTRKITFSKLLNNIENKDWIEVYKWYEENENQKLRNALKGLEFINEPVKISKENIEKLYNNNLKTSVSRLERYSSCPFSYFLQYGLKLLPKERLEIKSMDTGSFMHDVIDQFFKSVDDYKSVSYEEIKIIVDRIVDEKLNLGTKFALTAKYKIMCERLKEILYTSIKYIIESLKESSFEVLGTEVDFGYDDSKLPPMEVKLDNEKRVSIVGKIDRIDIAKMPDRKISKNNRL